MSSETQVAVLGLGYVGCVSAACLASMGHRVVGVDRDETKLQKIQNGCAPFYEPGLEELVREHVATGRLTTELSCREGLRDADIALVCVGTPSEKNGNLGLTQLKRVVSDISETLPERRKPLIVVIRSTVFPGTCEEVVIPIIGNRAAVVSNPEFLREGTAIEDFVKPSLVVVGGPDRKAVRQVADLYAPLGVPASLVSLRTAEMIKYACNAFHALKIGFANEIGSLSESLGVEGAEVMGTLCEDVKLNISPAYLKPGFAFGGSCLPKDLRALLYRANDLDLKLPLLESVLPANQAHLERAIHAVLELKWSRVGILGLAFKENTDDLRESPVIAMMEQLIGKGMQLRVFDPHIQLEEIYGANREFILKTIPHIGRLLQSNPEQILSWAEHLVITQKPGIELAKKIERSGLPVINLVQPSLLKAVPQPG